VRSNDRASTSGFHQGQRLYAAIKARIYGCNLYLFLSKLSESYCSFGGVHIWLLCGCAKPRVNFRSRPYWDIRLWLLCGSLFHEFKGGLFAPTHSKERDTLANALFQNDSTLLKLGHLALDHAIATTTQIHEFHMTGHSTAEMLRRYTHVVAKDIAVKAQTKVIR